MIGMFRFGLSLVATLAMGAVGCGHACNAIGCLDGLVLAFDGLVAGTTYQVTVSQVTATPETIPVATCTAVVAANGSPQLSCSSERPHTESSNTLQFHDTELTKLVITVSSNGMTLVNQAADVSYTSSEINGPGCGVCTQASVSVTVPMT